MAHKQKFVPLILFLSFFFIHGRSSDKIIFGYPYRSCSESTLPPNSTFFSNLKSLSSQLSSNSSTQLYTQASAGRPRNSPVYGDFQCRGDLNATACQRCVAAAAANSSQQLCPLSVRAVVWFDDCFYRYSNQSFFSVLEKQPPVILINGEKIEGDVDGFDRIVGSTLNDTVANASSAKGALKFATKEGSFRDVTVYTLAQCTADLSTSDCGKCLGNALRNLAGCCSGVKGARVLFSSCTFRYELYEFYGGVSRSSVSAPPAESPTALSPPPAESTSAPAAPSLPSSPSAPAPSTAAPPLLSGKERATVAMMFGILVAYFLC